DRAALAILYDRYIELVFGVCVKYLKDAHAAEDAAMDIFEALMTKLKSHRVDYFRGWLYSVSRNHCLQILRKRKPVITQEIDASIVHSGEHLHPDDRKLLEHRENGLLDCMSKLPEMQQQSIRMFYYESKSYQEISETLSVSKDRIRSYIQNGRRNLKRCMEKQHATRTAK
ncbi:MAG: sigma-70 family RNA polymerase sigma factor, partial [Saprospiraceae bacterium]|nr:sigma-70 family RNA polymerase sigma factor [Saprospiraceae bacterium]